MTFESPTNTHKLNRRPLVWRPGCKRLLPEKPVSSCNPATLQPDSQGHSFAFVSGIINRNPKKH